MAKDTITEDDRLKLIGIFELARSYREKLDDLEDAAADILDHESDNYGYYGHLSDAMYGGDSSVDSLLSKMDVEVHSDE